MKILHVADLHYTLKQFDWLCQTAAKFDLLIIAGDLLDLVSLVDLEIQIVVVMKYLRQLQEAVPMVISSGNHDLNAQCEDGERYARWLRRLREQRIFIDGDCVDYEGITFSIFPWREGPKSEAAIASQMKRDASQRKDHWYWIYHAPPVDTSVSWDGKRDFGDPALRTWIETYQPDVVFGGHIHQAPFTESGDWACQLGKSWILNNGRQIGPLPTFGVFDTEAQTFQWLSLAGQERLDLSNGNRVVLA
jgi:Icc-related predicted phosphoesterase